MGKKEEKLPYEQFPSLMSRRTFLRLLGAATGAAAGIGLARPVRNLWEGLPVYDPDLKIYLDKDGKLTFNEAKQLAERFFKLKYYQPEVGVDLSGDNLGFWIKEIIAQMDYNGLVVPYGLRHVNAGFIDYFTGREANHIAGISFCGGKISLNSRYVNPIDSWYQDIDSLITLVHELIHEVQGAVMCHKEGAETAATLGSWEIAASIANEGNRLMAMALVDELAETALGVCLGRAIKEDKLDEYEALKKSILSVERQALSARSLRFWQGNMSELGSILEDYYVTPYKLLLDNRDTWEISGLDLPIASGGGFGGVFPLNYEYPFEFDDLRYFMAHAEWLMEGEGEGRRRR